VLPRGRHSGFASVAFRLACGTALRHARDLTLASVTGGPNHSDHAPIMAASLTLKPAELVILAWIAFSGGTGLWDIRKVIQTLNVRGL